MSTACYGPFNLTKNVYHWNSNIKGNGQISDKWMKEIVFFGMLIVPAYMFLALLDTFIFNSMHFWTGGSLIKASDTGVDDTKVATVGDTTIRWTQSNDGGTVTYERRGVLHRRATIVSQATGYRLVDDDGNVLIRGDLRYRWRCSTSRRYWPGGESLEPGPTSLDGATVSFTERSVRIIQ